MTGTPANTANEPGTNGTGTMLDAARAGDRAAQTALFERFRPRLEGFLANRLPVTARAWMETGDIVQDTFEKALRNLHRTHCTSAGGFWVYLRQTGLNAVYDEYRKHGRKRRVDPMSEGQERRTAAKAPTPHTTLVGHEEIELFEKALECVSEKQREALLMRIELDMPYAQIADDAGYPSAAAARMSIQRALAKVAGAMIDLGHQP